MFSDSFKKAVIESVAIKPDDIHDKVEALAIFGNEILKVDDHKDDDNLTEEEMENAAKARMTLVLEFAEQNNISEAEVLVFIMLMAKSIGK
jgi:hypothetical protein